MDWHHWVKYQVLHYLWSISAADIFLMPKSTKYKLKSISGYSFIASCWLFWPKKTNGHYSQKWNICPLHSLDNRANSGRYQEVLLILNELFVCLFLVLKSCVLNFGGQRWWWKIGSTELKIFLLYIKMVSYTMIVIFNWLLILILGFFTL